MFCLGAHSQRSFTCFTAWFHTHKFHHLERHCICCFDPTSRFKQTLTLTKQLSTSGGKKWSQGRNAKSNSSLNGPLKQVRQRIPVKAFFFLTIERKAALIRAEPAVLWCRCLIAEPRTWHTCSVKLFNWHCLIIYSRLHAGLDRHGNILTVFHDDASFKCKIQGLFSFYQTSE